MCTSSCTVPCSTSFGGVGLACAFCQRSLISRDLAAQADGVNLRRARIDADRDTALQALAARVGHILEQEAGALLFLQAAELPAHQRHQLRVLVDRNGHAPQQLLLVELLQVRAQVLQIGFHLSAVVHSPTFHLQGRVTHLPHAEEPRVARRLEARAAILRNDRFAVSSG